MAVYNWVGLGLDALSRKWSWAKDASSMFSGEFSVTVGSALEAYYGTHGEHAFGSHTELNVSGLYGGLGGFMTAFLMEASPLTLLGIGGHTEFNLGSKTEANYGGPLVEILRGPKISKICYTPLSALSYWSKLSPELEDSLPEEPSAAEMALDDEKTLLAVKILLTLLSVSTAAFELAIRFAYPDYDPSGSSKEDYDPFSTPSVLDTVVSQLSETLMGIIYLYELAGTYTPLATQCKALATSAAEKASICTSYLKAPFVNIAEWYESAADQTKDVILVAAITIGLLIIIAAVVVGALAATGQL